MLRPPSRCLAWFLFFVPWLVVLAVPALRWQARIQFIGSEYAEDSPFTEPVALPAIWLFRRNLAPTWKQLQPAAKRSPDWKIAVDLKAPRQRGDDEIEAAEIYRVSGQLLKQKPREAYLLAVRLKAALAFVRDDRLVDEAKRFFKQPPGSASPSPFAAMTHHDLWQGYDEKSFPAAARRIWWSEEDREFDPKTDVSRIARPKKIATGEALKVALQVTRRGAALEPDNAYWPWQQSYLLLLLRQDAQAEKALLRAARLKRFDDHRQEDFQHTLRVAQINRPLLLEEKLALNARCSYQDKAFPKREDLWLLQVRRAERAGNAQKSLALSAALATIGALRLQIAHANDEKRNFLLLQCAAWQGGNRKPLQNAARKGKVATYYTLSDLNFVNWYNMVPTPATPDMFARRFAADARKAGRNDLAKAALQQGKEARRVAKQFHRYGNSSLGDNNGDFRFLPSLPSIVVLKWTAQMTLIQLQITLFFWCVLSLLLWRRLWFLGRHAARGWRIFGMIWRTRDKPLWDEDVPILEQEKRDAHRSFWFAALWVLMAVLGIGYWNMPLSMWYPETFQDDFDKAINLVPAITSLFLYPTAPVLFGLFWCGGAALKRYYRLQLPKVWRDDIETTAMHAPPSLIPIAAAFMVWSLTTLAVLCWLGCLLSYYLPPNSFNFTLPPLWALWLDMPAFSLFSRPPEWAVAATFVTLAALAAWLWKWSWQLHLRRRLPALYLGLNWWWQTLGAWLITASWLYLVLLLLALPARHHANAQFEKTLQKHEQNTRNL